MPIIRYNSISKYQLNIKKTVIGTCLIELNIQSEPEMVKAGNIICQISPMSISLKPKQNISGEFLRL